MLTASLISLALALHVSRQSRNNKGNHVAQKDGSIGKRPARSGRLHDGGAIG